MSDDQDDYPHWREYKNVKAEREARERMPDSNE